MKYHIALERAVDLESIAQDAKKNECPRHILWTLSEHLKAEIHKPGTDPVLPIDTIRAMVFSGTPELWAMARTLSSSLTRDDLIVCTGEDVGIPIAMLCNTSNRPKIVMFARNLDRPRERLAVKLFRLGERIDLFLAKTQSQIKFLRRHLFVPLSRILFFPDQTDTRFFTPGQPTFKRRPLVASVGLEKRDYRTLAKATENMYVDVKISASQNAKVESRLFPKTLPMNMSRHFYQGQDLVQLYRDADVVAISLFDNKYGAGIQALMEAMACRCPIVLTRTRGLYDYYAPLDVVTFVNPGDPVGLEMAIADLLNHPEKAQAQAQRAYEWAITEHNSDRYLEDLIVQLRSLESVVSKPEPAVNKPPKPPPLSKPP